MALLDLNSILDEIYTQEEKEKIIHSFDSKKYFNIFCNFLKNSSNDLELFLQDQGIKFYKIDEFCYKIPIQFKSKLSTSNAFLQAKFYIQNFSSYLCAKNLNVLPEHSVLDMCAAPGGKSLNLANFMENRGYLASCELSKTRFFTLKNNLKNYGVTNVKCFLKDAKIIGKLCPLKFDRILLDAPCSTYAKLGFNIQKNSKEIKQISKLQKQLLHSALNALKSGGELIYSTCTFLREENEEVIENAFKSEHKIKLLELNLSCANSIDAKGIEFDLSLAKRVIPDDFVDGFFIARIKKL